MADRPPMAKTGKKSRGPSLRAINASKDVERVTAGFVKLPGSSAGDGAKYSDSEYDGKRGRGAGAGGDASGEGSDDDEVQRPGAKASLPPLGRGQSGTAGHAKARLGRARRARGDDDEASSDSDESDDGGRGGGGKRAGDRGRERGRGRKGGRQRDYEVSGRRARDSKEVPAAGDGEQIGEVGANFLRGMGAKVADEQVVASEAFKGGLLKRKLRQFSSRRLKNLANQQATEAMSGWTARFYRVFVIGRAVDSTERAMRSLMVLMIFGGVLSVMTETVVWRESPDTENVKLKMVMFIEAVTTIAYIFEYFVRLVVCPVDKNFPRESKPPYVKRPIYGRVMFALRGDNLLDILLMAPFILYLVFPEFEMFDPTNEFGAVSGCRVLRTLRLSKFVRYSPQMQSLVSVIWAKRGELGTSGLICLSLVMLLSVFVFMAEARDNTDQFENLMDGLWWGVTTLTTVGYGDKAPITNSGRILAGFGAVLGIGLFTLPAGIIAQGYLEERDHLRNTSRRIIERSIEIQKLFSKKQAFYKWAFVMIKEQQAGAPVQRRPSLAGIIAPQLAPDVMVKAKELLHQTHNNMVTAMAALLEVQAAMLRDAWAAEQASMGTGAMPSRGRRR